MQSYTDDQGQEWSVEINGWTLKRVRDNAGVLLTSLLEENGKLYADLHADSILLADVVWPVIEEQANERSITVKQFALSFKGDVVARARDAVVEATIDFFDSPEARSQARELIGKINQIAEEISGKAAEKLQAVNPQEVAQSFITSSIG